MHIIILQIILNYCNIIIDKGNKYFASILMHAKQKRRVAALLFVLELPRPNIYLATCQI